MSSPSPKSGPLRPKPKAIPNPNPSPIGTGVTLKSLKTLFNITNSLKIVFIQSKSIFALKAVNLYHLGEKSKNDLIREIVFLEKLKNCDGVVKVNCR